MHRGCRWYRKHTLIGFTQHQASHSPKVHDWPCHLLPSQDNPIQANIQTTSKWVCYLSQTQTVERLSTQHQTVLVTFLGLRKLLYSCTEGMCHSSTCPGTSLHVISFTRDSLTFALKATNAGKIRIQIPRVRCMGPRWDGQKHHECICKRGPEHHPRRVPGPEGGIQYSYVTEHQLSNLLTTLHGLLPSITRTLSGPRNTHPIGTWTWVPQEQISTL